MNREARESFMLETRFVNLRPLDVTVIITPIVWKYRGLQVCRIVQW